jgi:hypothetical protein
MPLSSNIWIQLTKIIDWSNSQFDKSNYVFLIQPNNKKMRFYTEN